MTEHQPDDDAEAEREGLSRRGFLAGAAGLTGVAVSGVWRGSAARAADASSAASVVAPSGFVFLDLNVRIVGSVKSVDGGTPVAEVVEEPPGPDGLVHKHIGNVKYDDFTVQLGLGMGR